MAKTQRYYVPVDVGWKERIKRVLDDPSQRVVKHNQLAHFALEMFEERFFAGDMLSYTPAQYEPYQFQVRYDDFERAKSLAASRTLDIKVVWYNAIAWYLDWFEREVAQFSTGDPVSKQKEHLRRARVDEEWIALIRFIQEDHGGMHAVIDRQLAARALDMLEEHLRKGGELLAPTGEAVKSFKVLSSDTERADGLVKELGVKPGAVWHNAVRLYVEWFEREIM